MTRLCHHITSGCTQKALTVSFAIIDRGWKTSYVKAILEYGNLSEHELSGWELQQYSIYGNGEVQTPMYITSFATTQSTHNIIHRYDEKADERGGLGSERAQIAVNGITAHLRFRSANRGGSVFTAYSEDDKAVWKKLRRQLAKDVF